MLLDMFDREAQLGSRAEVAFSIAGGVSARSSHRPCCARSLERSVKGQSAASARRPRREDPRTTDSQDRVTESRSSGARQESSNTLYGFCTNTSITSYLVCVSASWRSSKRSSRVERSNCLSTLFHLRTRRKSVLMIYPLNISFHPE